jgi:guanylate kinase
MLEWANVYGHFYGTPFDFVKEKMAIGEDVLLDIDVQGAYQVKKRLPHAVLIFILPPSWEELKRRLLTRSADSAQAIKTRLKAAKKEIELAKNFDYIVINNTLENTLDELESIIHATKAKAIKHGKMIEELIKITPF